ncbi:MAG: pyridoxal-dependent decarboxylase, partial [Xanthomonadales bacterium]
MTPEAFRRAGHELIDWIADYRQRVETLPVRARVAPGDVRRNIGPRPPEQPVDFGELLADLERSVVPGITQVQHPMHFGWFPSNAALSSVLGDIACAGLGTLGISWESCPALTEVEEAVCDWMRQLAGLSDAWRGTIHDTASTACLTSLLVARERHSDYSEFGGGLQALDRPLVVYASDQAHSSVVKAALLAGFGHDNLRLVATDPKTRAMAPDALEHAIEADRAAGRIPAAIVVSLGTTGVTAFDPLADIVAIAQRHGCWAHVDAAMAGSAMLLPECRSLFDGIEGADALSWNPHKWIGTILDTSLFYVRDPLTLNRVMSTNPAYLQSAEDGCVTQFR